MIPERPKLLHGVEIYRLMDGDLDCSQSTVRMTVPQVILALGQRTDSLLDMQTFCRRSRSRWSTLLGLRSAFSRACMLQMLRIDSDRTIAIRDTRGPKEARESVQRWNKTRWLLWLGVRCLRSSVVSTIHLWRPSRRQCIHFWLFQWDFDRLCT